MTEQINDSDVVPPGKKLYILQFPSSFIIDGMLFENQNFTYGQPLILNDGQQISSISNESNYINGYLVDEDYFADCSGGGGSTANS